MSDRISDRTSKGKDEEQDRIEKSVALKAPVARVWKALTDHHEFGEWFRVKLHAPFAVGEVSTGQITYPGYEHLEWAATVQVMEHERLFSFTWQPGPPEPGSDSGMDPGMDTDSEPSTLVEFRLEPIAQGTRLTVVESGFSALPPGRRADVLRLNESGWQEQMSNIKAHVE